MLAAATPIRNAFISIIQSFMNAFIHIYFNRYMHTHVNIYNFDSSRCKPTASTHVVALTPQPTARLAGNGQPDPQLLRQPSSCCLCCVVVTEAVVAFVAAVYEGPKRTIQGMP